MNLITRAASGFALVFALTVFAGCSDNTGLSQVQFSAGTFEMTKRLIF